VCTHKKLYDEVKNFVRACKILERDPCIKKKWCQWNELVDGAIYPLSGDDIIIKDPPVLLYGIMMGVGIILFCACSFQLNFLNNKAR